MATWVNRNILCNRVYNCHGTDAFTLIEVIILITMGALIAAMTVPFVGTALTRSAEPVNRIRDNFEINRVMGFILADYREQYADDDFDLQTFNNTMTDYENSATTGVDDITVTGEYITYDASGSYADTDGDGAYDAAAYTGASPRLLRVTVFKYKDSDRQQSLQVILAGR